MDQSTPPVAPLHPWSWPTRPWGRLHLDYAGPFEGKMILIIVDAHSKWIEAICTPGSTSAVVIDELQTLFAQFGLLETIVTNNGPCFVSSKFETFLVCNGIKHLTSAPYHPSSNGLAERAFQLVILFVLGPFLKHSRHAGYSRFQLRSNASGVACDSCERRLIAHARPRRPTSLAPRPWSRFACYLHAQRDWV